MSIHEYNRVLIGEDWTISVKLLAEEAKASLPGKAFHARGRHDIVRLTFDDVLTPGEVATLQAVVDNNIAAGPYAPPIAKPPKQFLMSSQNGSVFRITVSNLGVLIVTPQ